VIWDAILAAGGFLAGAVALFSMGRRGISVSSLAVGLGVGAVSSLSAGPEGFWCLAGLGAAAAVLIELGGRLPFLEVSARVVGARPVTEKPRVFGDRSVRAVLGAVGLFTARLLSGHLTAGTVATQGPGFACLFIFEVGLIRIGTGRGPADLGLGGFCAGMGAAGFLLLSFPGSAMAVALLAAGTPAVVMVALARATPWETSS